MASFLTVSRTLLCAKPLTVPNFSAEHGTRLAASMEEAKQINVEPFWFYFFLARWLPTFKLLLVAADTPCPGWCVACMVGWWAAAVALLYEMLLGFDKQPRIWPS